MPTRKLAPAVRRNEEDRKLSGGSQEVVEEQQARSVCPVQVVEHDQHRRGRQRGEHGAHRFEQAIAGRIVLAEGRGGEARFADRRDGREQGADVGEVGRQGNASRLDVGLERLNERLIGDQVRGIAPAVQHGAGVVRPNGQFGSQASLSDPGVAGDKRQLTALGQDGLQQVLEHRELAVTADQGSLGTQAGGDRRARRLVLGPPVDLEDLERLSEAFQRPRTERLEAGRRP